MHTNRPQNPTAAVVVTHNRIDLLRQCVAQLENQTRACDILIVDNASTDGTAQWLASQPDLHCRNTGANLGGAGGFNLGMRWAVEAGYDYVWVMDDDCLPRPDALEKLLEADRILEGSYGWLSSVALWTDGNRCRMNLQRKTPYREIEESDQTLVPSVMASFVSLFMKRSTVAAFGLPISEFVIWSDDWEYTRRISMKTKCYTIQDSQVIHAMKSNGVVNIATDTLDRLPRYRYFYRNDVYLYRREGLRGWVWLVAKDIWHFFQVVILSESQKRKRLNTILNGFWDGLSFQPDIETIHES